MQLESNQIKSNQGPLNRPQAGVNTGHLLFGDKDSMLFPLGLVYLPCSWLPLWSKSSGHVESMADLLVLLVLLLLMIIVSGLLPVLVDLPCRKYLSIFLSRG